MMFDVLKESVINVISEVVRREMDPFGLRDVHASAGHDHDGDPVIYVDVDYEAPGPAVDLKVTSRLVTKLRDHLWDIGETRFPHIRHHFSAIQQVIGL